MKKKKFTPQQTADFCRNLSLLVQAGIPLSDGLFLMAQEQKQRDSAVLTELGGLLDKGATFAEAMEKSNVFPSYAVGMVCVGERTGRLENSLFSLAEYYDDRCRINRMLKNALVYPVIIMLLMLIVVAVLLMKVLPVFEEVYASLGTRLTGIGAGLLHLGQALSAALPALLVILGIISAAVLLFVCCAAFREKILAFYRRCFGDRGVSCRFNNAQFARALSMGLSSGLPLEEAFELSRELLEDIPGAYNRCGQCSRLLGEDVPLPKALEQTGFLSASDSRLLTVGTRGGNSDRVMKEIADRLMEDASNALESRVLRVEPTIVLVASLLVGAILLSVMLPLANIMSSIG